MKYIRPQLTYSLASLFCMFGLNVAANPPTVATGLANKPLFLGETVRPNIMFSLDDSGSMDSEVLFADGANDGALFWSDTHGYVRTTSTAVVIEGVSTTTYGWEYVTSGKKSVNLFPNEASGTYKGKRIYSDDSGHFAIPPVKSYAFARASEYNHGYYDPSVTYTPWPSYLGYTFIQSPPTAAPFEPIGSSVVSTVGTWADASWANGDGTNDGGVIDLTATRTAPTTTVTTTVDEVTTTVTIPVANTTFKIHTGMVCDDAGRTLTSTPPCDTNADISYYPATYYVVDRSDIAFNYKDKDGLTHAANCSATLNPLIYQGFAVRPGDLTTVDAIAPDGACLKKVEIKSSTANYNVGETYTRAYAEEINNFANWFTYYRKRHQAMRGSVANSLKEIAGINSGLFWFNNRRGVSSMPEFDSKAIVNTTSATDSQKFIRDLYNTVRSGGTPTRKALQHAGEEYKYIDASNPGLVTASCQRNYTLLFTDGYGDTATNSPAPGNADNEAGNFSGVDPFKDSFDNTLADVAMHYYTTNLNPDLPVGKSPIPVGCKTFDFANPTNLDCNPNLHMNTYIVGLNTVGDSIFGITHNKVEDAYTTKPTWVAPTAGKQPVQADDLYHAAVNGRGEAFNAASPNELSIALQKTVDAIIASATEGSGSGVAFNTSTLKNGSAIMAASFNTTRWSGELEEFTLNATTGALSTTPAWQASKVLDKQIISDRFIFTYNPSAKTTSAFALGNLTTSQLADLNMGPSGVIDNKASERVNYFRGDRSLEGAGFRARNSLLGDIIHSSPVFVGAPALSYPDSGPFGVDGNRYTKYKTDKASRKKVVYVGANDGMLHGFSTETVGTQVAGSEVLAYVPNAMYSNATNKGLHYLTDPNYSHINYVDGSPVAADVYKDSAWKTIIVGGFRGGAKGVYAIDVTDPTTFDNSVPSNFTNKVLFEFTHADMGYVTGKPVVAMMNNSKWAVVIGNGYGGSGTKLFIIYLDGTYKVIDTGSTTGNGLSAPALADLDGDGKVDRIYAGDLGGNMWAFDVSSTTDGSWDLAYNVTTGPTTGRGKFPLFTATESGYHVQPITTAPVLTINPNVPSDYSNGGNKPNVLVLFGTGQYLVNNDVSNTDEQSFYAVWDSGTPKLNRTNLNPRSITTYTSEFFRKTAGADMIWDGTGKHDGWYIDFDVSADTGERVVLTPNVRGETVFFNTTIPSGSAAACEAGGRGYLMSVNLKDGVTPTKPVFDNTGDNKIDGSDTPYSGQLIGNIPMDSGFLGNRQYTPTNVGTIIEREIEVIATSREGRLSWIEIFTN